jgi:hypothetical protein
MLVREPVGDVEESPAAGGIVKACALSGMCFGDGVAAAAERPALGATPGGVLGTPYGPRRTSGGASAPTSRHQVGPDNGSRTDRGKEV